MNFFTQTPVATNGIIDFSNWFRILRFRAIDLSNLKPVSRIQANQFGDGLVEQTKMADCEAISHIPTQ